MSVFVLVFGVSASAQDTGPDVIVYVLADMDSAEQGRYDQAVARFKKGGWAYETRAATRAEVTTLANLGSPSVIPRFFTEDPTAGGFVSKPKTNNGGLRWLKSYLASNTPKPTPAPEPTPVPTQAPEPTPEPTPEPALQGAEGTVTFVPPEPTPVYGTAPQQSACADCPLVSLWVDTNTHQGGLARIVITSDTALEEPLPVVLRWKHAWFSDPTGNPQPFDWGSVNFFEVKVGDAYSRHHIPVTGQLVFMVRMTDREDNNSPFVQMRIHPGDGYNVKGIDAMSFDTAIHRNNAPGDSPTPDYYYLLNSYPKGTPLPPTEPPFPANYNPPSPPAPLPPPPPQADNTIAVSYTGTAAEGETINVVFTAKPAPASPLTFELVWDDGADRLVDGSDRAPTVTIGRNGTGEVSVPLKAIDKALEPVCPSFTEDATPDDGVDNRLLVCQSRVHNFRVVPIEAHGYTVVRETTRIVVADKDLPQVSISPPYSADTETEGTEGSDFTFTLNVGQPPESVGGEWTALHSEPFTVRLLWNDATFEFAPDFCDNKRGIGLRWIGPDWYSQTKCYTEVEIPAAVCVDDDGDETAADYQDDGTFTCPLEHDAVIPTSVELTETLASVTRPYPGDGSSTNYDQNNGHQIAAFVYRGEGYEVGDPWAALVKIANDTDPPPSPP